MRPIVWDTLLPLGRPLPILFLLLVLLSAATGLRPNAESTPALTVISSSSCSEQSGVYLYLCAGQHLLHSTRTPLFQGSPKKTWTVSWTQSSQAWRLKQAEGAYKGSWLLAWLKDRRGSVKSCWRWLWESRLGAREICCGNLLNCWPPVHRSPHLWCDGVPWKTRLRSWAPMKRFTTSR